MDENKKHYCDLVMEGGGVKGIALVGALRVLQDEGYSFRRIAGTSAGALVGSLVATGAPLAELETLLETLDYRQFRDKGFLDRFGIFGKTASLIFEKGVFEGKFLTEWLSAQLKKYGIETFGDLKLTEAWAKDLPPEQRYKLVVIVADVSRGRLVRLPWDYDKYGLDRDKQRVADAVRASISIPFFYEPARLGSSYLVDGAVLSNFPIDLFESTPNWPTFGLKLSAKPDANLQAMNPANDLNNAYDIGRAILATMMNARDNMHLDDPCVTSRTIFIDTMDVQTTDFDINKEKQMQLYYSGREAAGKFISRWDFDEYLKNCHKS